MECMKIKEDSATLAVKPINFIKFLSENLKFFEENVYKEDVFSYYLGGLI